MPTCRMSCLVLRYTIWYGAAASEAQLRLPDTPVADLAAVAAAKQLNEAARKAWESAANDGTLGSGDNDGSAAVEAHRLFGRDGVDDDEGGDEEDEDSPLAGIEIAVGQID